MRWRWLGRSASFWTWIQAICMPPESGGAELLSKVAPDQLGEKLRPMKIIYSPGYNITLFGLERLHPFDSKKYGRAWALLKQEFGKALSKYHVPVKRAVSREDLLLV